jgi:1-acyl-sn-glycerol-3-phosphate acyltransferase
MTGHRVLLRILGATTVSLGGVAFLALLRLLAPLAPAGAARREDRAIRAWARSMCAIVGLSVQVEGAPPEGEFLLVCNHLSYLDVLAIMSQLDARLLSKAEVASWPGLGPLARFGGTLFVDRTRRRDLPRVIGEIRGVLEQGRGVVFFPEGTSSPGLEVLPFKPSLFEVAAEGRIPVSVAALHYRTPAEERPAQWSVAWWGDMEFLPHLLDLLRLPRIEARLRLGEAPVEGSDRKQLALETREAVLRLFEPLAEELGEDAPGPGRSA